VSNILRSSDTELLRTRNFRTPALPAVFENFKLWSTLPLPTPRRNGSPDTPFRHGLSVQSGGRLIQVTVTDRGPFTGAFLDLSPAAASALGCRCTHRNVTATIMQLGSGATVVAGRVVNAPSLR
jgi:Lytic transglycolase